MALNQAINEIRETNSVQGEEETQSENEPTWSTARIAEEHRSNGRVCFGAKTRTKISSLIETWAVL